MKSFKFHFTTLLLTLLLLSLLLLRNSECASAATTDPINTIPQPVPITADKLEIQQQLEQYIDEMVNLGHLAPTMYFIGIGGRPVIFYATPAETIYTLSAAYPYLSDGLKARVKTYLNNELTMYPPHNTGYYGPNAGKFSDFAGTHREYFIQNPEQSYNFWPGIDVDPSVLYALWLYAHNTGDWSYVTTHYNSLRSIYTLAKNDGGINSYPELSGVIGFARIAQHLNHTADYNDAWNFAQTGLNAARDFNQFLTIARQRYPARSHEYTTQPFLFHRQEQHTMVIATHFNRDIGIFLQENAQPAVASYASQIADDVNLWWLTDVAMAWGENAYATPEISWTNFMLHAYVLETPLAELKSYLDAPTRRGDLLYIQKLVATLESGPVAPFTVKLALSHHNVNASESAIYTIQVQRSAEFTPTITLVPSNPSPDLQVELTPTSFATDGTATLTLTDRHSPSFTESVWYNVDIVATGGDIQQTVRASLLVNGKQTFLPLILKN